MQKEGSPKKAVKQAAHHSHRKPRRMPWHRRERRAAAEREMETTVQQYQEWTESAREGQRPADPVQDGA